MTPHRHSLVTASQPVNADQNGDDPPVFRLEIRRAATLAIAERPVFGSQFTLSSRWPVAREFLLTPYDTLGWLDHKRLDRLTIRAHYPANNDSRACLSTLFRAEQGCLQAKVPLRIYVISHDIDIIRQHGVLLFSLSSH